MPDTAAMNARLDSIEGEVRRIADSLGLLIRLDERVIATMQTVDELKSRVTALEGRSGRDHWTVSAFTKFGWIVAAGLLAFGSGVVKDRWFQPTYQQQDNAGKLPRIEGK